MKKVAVNDANILIDFFEIALLDELFQLDLEMHTTDLVVAEITDAAQEKAIRKLINSGKLAVQNLGAAQLAAAVGKQSARPRLSLEDCSVWQLSEKLGAILLTGDGVLRKTAREAGIEVHGSLWLLDELFRAALLDQPTACVKLRELMLANRRLPEKACQDRLKRWCDKNE